MPEPILVHATNLTSLGARQVACSLIAAVADQQTGHPVHCCLPAAAPVPALPGADITFYCLDRVPSDQLSRALECLFTPRYLPRFRYGLVLGNIPLRNLDDQVVMVHQAHLVTPAVNRFVSRRPLYRIMRRVFRRNLQFARWLVVQSEVMKRELAASYPEAGGRIVVLPHPPPACLPRGGSERRPPPPSGPSLFYPAAGYPHKNHQLLSGMAAASAGRRVPFGELLVTLGERRFRELGVDALWLKNVGRLSASACAQVYDTIDALFFPSRLESYGLPLVEAMVKNLPVVCADLPYARWLCEDEAIYFDPSEPEAALQAIALLRERLTVGWRPHWAKPLAKLLKSWPEMADRCLALLLSRAEAA